jgi:hypothetical protein
MRRLLRLSITVGLVGVVLIVLFSRGVNVTSEVHSACGCGSLNEWIWEDVKSLDAKINQYTSTHNGQFPTFADTLTLYAEVDPAPYAPTLRSFIDPITGAIMVPLDDRLGKSILYAVSTDRHSYILRGVGISQRNLHIILFGIDLGWHGWGYDYPILTAGDPEPQ